MRAAILVLCAFVLVHEMSAVPIKDKTSNEDKDVKTSPEEEAKPRQSIPSTTYDPVQSVQEGPDMDGSYTQDDPYNTPYNTPCNYDTTAGCTMVGQQPPVDLFNKKVQLVAVKDLNIKNGKVKQPIKIIQG